MRRAFFLAAALWLAASASAWDIPDPQMDSAPGQWRAENGVILAKDANGGKGGSAALSATLPSATQDARLVLEIKPDRPGKYPLAIHLKSEGASGAVGFMAFNGGAPVGGWQHLGGYQPGDWQEIRHDVELPGGASHGMLIITMGAAGKLLLDDLSVEGASGKKLPAGAAATLPAEDMSRYGANAPLPEIVNVGAVAPDTLCVEVREFRLVPGKLEPYRKQPGDTFREQKRDSDGVVMERFLIRGGNEVGRVVGPEKRQYLHSANDYSEGKPLDRAKALLPETWSLSAAGKTLKPKEVHLKQKPLGPAGKQMRVNWYCLRFAEPLKARAQYTLDFGQYGMKKQFAFAPEKMRSEAVHASHVGYRPDDPAKFGFLSYWNGTGGAVDYPAGLAFHLLDAKSGKKVFSGKTALRFAKDKPSYGVHAKGRNYALTDVYACDFSSFKETGEYVLYVEGIGTSFPFPIRRDAWETAAKCSFRGFFHQRGGQEWKKPWADWEQPRAFHPADGDVFWELSKSKYDIVTETGKSCEDNMETGVFEKWKTGKKIANAWGGYYDAGDYDRHFGHLICSRDMLELVELFPDYFRKLKLPIPESGNDLPDALDEALWAPALYKRMQREDGAIYGGIETNGHPKPGEPAYLDSLTRYVFAPEPTSAWEYAATAARAAHVLSALGKKKEAADWQKSAERAMAWAEKEYAARKEYHEKGDWWHRRDSRNLAAVALYRVSGDKKWHRIFRDTCAFADADEVSAWGRGLQSEAAFIYARLPEKLADAKIRAHALAGLENLAKRLIAYSNGLSFMWSAPLGDPGFPLILSCNAAPWGQPLCRAYALTKKREYLDYAVRTTLFSVGANPQNMTFTTRLGHRSPEFPLQCNTMAAHQPKPYSGYTVYGLAALGPAPQWVTQWHIPPTAHAPAIDTWPIEESYWDVECWPMVNENTVHQSMSTAVYVWGFLAARD